MNTKWSIPSIEVVKDTELKRILLSLADNVNFLYGDYVNYSKLINAGVIKVDKQGNYTSSVAQQRSDSNAQTSATNIYNKNMVLVGGSTAIGTYYTTISLPTNSRVIRSWYEVTSPFTGGAGAAISFRVKYDGINYTDIITSSDVTVGWTIGLHEGVQTGAAVSFSQKTTAYRSLEYEVSGDVLTGGRAVIFVQYAVIN